MRGRQYRRRWSVSRPCSGWERVGPPRARHRPREGDCGWACGTRSVSRARDPAGGTPARERARRPRPLVPLSSRHYCLTPARLSTRWSTWGLTRLRDGRSHLEVGFALRCFQRLSLPDVGYPAMPLAGQLVHRRSVHPGPLVLGAAPRKSPTPTTDRDRTVSRRSEPSSRTALMGEQPNPWDLLQPQDATSRHRGAKPCRRCGLLGKISLLSPG